MVSMKKTENKKTKVKGNKKPFFTISKKILALSLLPMIIVCALVATVGAKALETGIEKQIERLCRSLVSVWMKPTRICMKAITPEIREARCARAAHPFPGRHS